MITVIQEGKQRKTKCPKCKSIIGYHPKDKTTRGMLVDTGMSKLIWNEIKCPVCDYKIQIGKNKVL